jgi:hypothetical protein
MEITKETLVDLYVTQNKTAREIADFFGYKSPQPILNKLNQYGIQIRSGRTAQKCIDLNYYELYDLYIIKTLSISQVVQVLGVSSDETVRRSLERYGIKRRSKTYKFGGQNKGKHLSYEQRKKMSETRKTLFMYGDLIHWNTGNHRSLETRLKISKTLLMGREPSPSDYGTDWKIQRTSCLQRDNYTCQQCERQDNLEVHHWEPYRFTFDNSLENLISFCEKCHREIHQIYYEEGFIKEAEDSYYA